MRARTLLAALAVLLGGPAQASVSFLFVQTGSTPPNAVFTTGGLVLSDAAFASGVSVNAQYMAPQVDWNALGIEALQFFIAGQSFSLADFVPAAPVPFPYPAWSVMLTSAPFGVPTGRIFFNDSNYDVTYVLNGAASTGSYNADFGPAPCGLTGVCSFTGDFVRALPEPMSLGLFAGALLGLGLLRAPRHAGPPSAGGADRP